MTTGGPWDNSPRRPQSPAPPEPRARRRTREQRRGPSKNPPPPRAALGVWSFSFWVTLGSRLPAARLHFPERNRFLSSLPLNRRQNNDSEPVPDVSR